MSAFHAAIAPYLAFVERENSESGLPMMRPLFLHHGDDEVAWTLKDEYLLGEDLLVAPVMKEGAINRLVHLPPGTWIHLWSGRQYIADKNSASERVEAPLGEPPLFLREGSHWTDLFQSAVKATRSRYSRP